MSDCDEIVATFLMGLKERFVVTRKNGDVCAITSPFETYSGEPVRVYVERVGDRFLLTDMGATLGNLFQFNVKESTVVDHIQASLRSYGAFLDSDAIAMLSNKDDLQRSLLGFITAVQQVSALELKARSEKTQHFEVAVRAALNSRRIPYDGAWNLEIHGVRNEVDFASTNHRALFVAAGTVVNSRGQMMSLLKKKLFTYLEMETAEIDDDYDRYVILDEATEWPEDAYVLARAHSDKILEWPDESREVESILLSNTGFNSRGLL